MTGCESSGMQAPGVALLNASTAPEAKSVSANAPFSARCNFARLHPIAADPAAMAIQFGLTPSDTVATSVLLRAAKEAVLEVKLSGTSATPPCAR
ncbi:hypothetical protein [Variovorax rhizosphaerae]|uniref:Uncharacterized protein n=1 Tax=Variovorax rhizosphaerae TaxID=1836200 RepID=A0ABU8WQ51_9BURK